MDTSIKQKCAVMRQLMDCYGIHKFKIDGYMNLLWSSKHSPNIYNSVVYKKSSTSCYHILSIILGKRLDQILDGFLRMSSLGYAIYLNDSLTAKYVKIVDASIKTAEELAINIDLAN